MEIYILDSNYHDISYGFETKVMQTLFAEFHMHQCTGQTRRRFHGHFRSLYPIVFPPVHQIFPASHCAQATVSALFIREFCLPRISATDVAGSIGRHPHPDPNGLLPSCPASTPCWRYSSSPFLSSLRRFSRVLVCSKYPLECGFSLRCCHLCMLNYRSYSAVLARGYAVACWVRDQEIF